MLLLIFSTIMNICFYILYPTWEHIGINLS